MDLGQRRQLVFVLSGILLAAILVGGVFWLWSDEDEVVIRRNLDELVEYINKTGDEAPFVILMETQNIMRTFTEEPVIEIGSPAPSRMDREELQAFVYQARNNLNTIEITLHEVEIEVAEDRQTAESLVTATAEATYQGDVYQEAREFRLYWIKEGGDWVIQGAELLNQLEWDFQEVD